jgi:uncharacterized protein YkwD
VSTRRPWLVAAAMLTAAVVTCAAPRVATAESSTVPACAGATQAPTIGADAAVAQAVLCLVDGERAAAGLRALSDSPLLDAAASAYAARMVAQDFFDHAAPDGSTLETRIAATGYDLVAAGEDIGYATGTDATAAAMVAAWMASPAHRANILDPTFTDLGVGVAPGIPGGLGGATYVADFGARAASTSDGTRASTAAAAPARHRVRCTRKRARRHLCRLPRHRRRV